MNLKTKIEFTLITIPYSEKGFVNYSELYKKLNLDQYSLSSYLNDFDFYDKEQNTIISMPKRSNSYWYDDNLDENKEYHIRLFDSQKLISALNYFFATYGNNNTINIKLVAKIIIDECPYFNLFDIEYLIKRIKETNHNNFEIIDDDILCKNQVINNLKNNYYDY